MLFAVLLINTITGSKIYSSATNSPKLPRIRFTDDVPLVYAKLSRLMISRPVPVSAMRDPPLSSWSVLPALLL